MQPGKPQSQPMLGSTSGAALWSGTRGTTRVSPWGEQREGLRQSKAISPVTPCDEPEGADVQSVAVRGPRRGWGSRDDRSGHRASRGS